MKVMIPHSTPSASRGLSVVSAGDFRRLKCRAMHAAAVLALGFLGSSIQAASAYPLIGLAVKDPRTSPPGVPMTAAHAHQFRMIYGGDTSSFVSSVLDVPNRDPEKTSVIPYMGGYTT